MTGYDPETVEGWRSLADAVIDLAERWETETPDDPRVRELWALISDDPPETADG